MWTSLNKKIYLFLGIILAIGIILGVVFLIYLDEASKEIILLNINEWLQGLENNHINNIFIHIVILSSLCILSIFLVGVPIFIFWVFYSGFSLGFLAASIINIFGIKGLLYSVVYIVVSKGIYLFFLAILIATILKGILLMGRYVIRKERINKDTVTLMYKRVLLCLGIILFSDIIIYFGGAKLITLFNFLLN